MKEKISKKNGCESTQHRVSTPVDDTALSRRPARIQFGLYLAMTIGVLIYLLWPEGNEASTGIAAETDDSLESPVSLNKVGSIQIRDDSPIRKQLQTVKVRPKNITAPMLTVTGRVVASLRSTERGEKDWQFDSPELLSTYTDWQKTRADILFAKGQSDAIGQLAKNRIAALEARVARLMKLVEAGTETENDLAAARTDLLEAQIQGRKDLHESETSTRLAVRAEAALRRQLQQAGLDPDMLREKTTETDIVVADVPEGLLSRVKIGQGCEAKFLGTGDRVFSGTIRSISPVLSQERRSLRVLFCIGDPDDLLRPGMFADIGLGTDAREALFAPVAGVVHVGDTDFMLVREADGAWRPAPVEVGELHDTEVEILDGLQTGNTVMGQGTILLKPFIIEATERPASSGTVHR